MSDRAVWSEDKCTCGHVVSKHANGSGRCDACDDDMYWGSRLAKFCNRFQWDGEERVRTW